MDQESSPQEEILDLTIREFQMICKRYILQESGENLKFKIIGHTLKPAIGQNAENINDHYLLKVTILPKKVSYEKIYSRTDLTFMVKLLFDIDENSNDCNGFDKEILLYQFLLPRLQDVPNGNEKWAATCYFTRHKKFQIFEDLTSKGYRISNRDNLFLDLDHLEVALRTVARFHATSVVLEERTHFSISHNYPDYLIENAYNKDESMLRDINVQECCDTLIKISLQISKYKSSSNEIKNQIRDKLPEVIKSIRDFAETSTKYRNVLNHGDLCCNSIMFAYKPRERRRSSIFLQETIIVECDIEADENGLPTKCHKRKSIDENPIECLLTHFQLARYSPPAFDIMSLITTSTDSNFRSHNLKHLLNVYKTTFLEEINRDEICVEELMNQIKLEESCEEYKLAGLIESCLINGSDLPELDLETIIEHVEVDGNHKTQSWLRAFHMDEGYRSRMTDILCEIIDNYVIE